VVSYTQGQKGMNKMIVKPPTSLVMVMGRKLCRGPCDPYEVARA
jgi:hypothetical protein